ncbi:inositol-1,4,5-triphosphate 5-phosphatase [Scheffersomyces coipomensis]|uniref:inositol-1,4,5-triphosphate 5-phosphatase n=1 Tax=Scheffersomyces coipomensis TaxID=1788519 RepID=UPI00315CDCEA
MDNKGIELHLDVSTRTFVLKSNNHTLIIRHPFPTINNESRYHVIHRHLNSKASSSNPKGSGGASLFNKVLVEFVQSGYFDVAGFSNITPKKKKLIGFLGLLNIKDYIYLGFITSEETVAYSIGDKVMRITGVDFYCLNSDAYDNYLNIDDIPDPNIQTTKKPHSYPAASVRRFLMSGSFYYSKTFDITTHFGHRFSYSKMKTKLVGDNPYFKVFMWNSFMLSELIEFRNRLSSEEQTPFDSCGFLTTITRGYAQTVDTTIGDARAQLTIITKQSCFKNGPLFGDWGCDEEGAVSNFSESEVIVHTEKYCFSYVIVKGNVPIYWELESKLSKKNILSSKKVVLSRSFESSQFAFKKHFEELERQFGHIHILNAISRDPKSYKSLLTKAYEEHINFLNKSREDEFKENIHQVTESQPNKLSYTYIPVATSNMKKYGYTTRTQPDLYQLLEESIYRYQATVFDIQEGKFTNKQLAVFRINSFDSLSKANYISKIVSQELVLSAFRIPMGEDAVFKHAKLWANNDEQISRITEEYISTTNKLNTSKSLTTKTTTSMKNHISTKYFIDVKPNTSGMLKLLGKMEEQVSISIFNPIHDYVSKRLAKVAHLFTSEGEITMFAATFNVNGINYDGDLRDWIFPPSTSPQDQDYSLVFVGFQEIVQLNASQMINTDASNLSIWERNILRCLNKRNPNNAKYVSMWNGQIGGIAHLVFVKESDLNKVSYVEGSLKKTGFGGISANKGATAVSFRYGTTTFCFVTSHLAAGHNNVEERHHNYKSIMKNITFSKNRKIRNHDVVIWLGDFNYRISLPHKTVMDLIDDKNYPKLFEFDQLNKEMANGESFPYFAESEIKFPPTYKFNNESNEYDTSEKQRIPAWTDRILYLSRVVRPINYSSVPSIIFSDHRPIYGQFKIIVTTIDKEKRSELSSKYYAEYKKEYGNEKFILASDFSHLLDDNIRELPAPSSEISKWWLNGKSAKINIPELNYNNEDGEHGNENYDDNRNVINPKLPINPFEQTHEPEVIRKNLVISS